MNTISVFSTFYHMAFPFSLRQGILFLLLYQLCTLDLGEHIPTYICYPFWPYHISLATPSSGCLWFQFSDCSQTSNMLSFFVSWSSSESQPLRPTVKHNLSTQGPFSFLRVLFSFPNQQSLFFIDPQFHLVLSEIYYLLQNQRGIMTKYFLLNIVFPPWCWHFLNVTSS